MTSTTRGLTHSTTYCPLSRLIWMHVQSRQLGLQCSQLLACDLLRTVLFFAFSLRTVIGGYCTALATFTGRWRQKNSDQLNTVHQISGIKRWVAQVDT